MARQEWSATGVIEAPFERVAEVLLVAREGPVGPDNAPLLRALPVAGRWVRRATLRGGPREYTIHYGHGSGGVVELDPVGGRFVFQGGYKFRAEYRFTPHSKGTLLTYSAFNVAPYGHQNRVVVRFQFWLSGRLRIGLRGGLRFIGARLGCRVYPGG